MGFSYSSRYSTTKEHDKGLDKGLEGGKMGLDYSCKCPFTRGK
jgi:hypothetical protein